MPLAEPISLTLFPLFPLVTQVRSLGSLAYPAGKGSNSMRRTIDSNTWRVRWLSAKRSQ